MHGSKWQHCRFLKGDKGEPAVLGGLPQNRTTSTGRQSKEQKIETGVLGSKEGALVQITKKTSNRSIYQRLFFMKFLKNYSLLPLLVFAVSSPVAWMSSTALVFWSSSKACGEQENKISVSANREKITFKVFIV